MNLGTRRRRGEGDGCFGTILVVGILLVIAYVAADGCKGSRGTGGGDRGWFEPDPQVTDLRAGWDTGVFSHDLLLTNGYPGDLAEVDVTITLTPTSGQKREGKQYWTAWAQGETRKVNVAADKYQKLQVKGTAKNKGKKVVINTEWSWDWK